MRNSKPNIFTKIYDFFDVFGHSILFTLMILAIGTMLYIAIIPNPIKRAANEKELYRNETCIIVGSNEAAQDFSHDKFHRPIVLKVWLIQRVTDTTQFTELTSSWDDNHFYVTKELWYSKGIGDTLHFDYIRKDRFFTINKK